MVSIPSSPSAFTPDDHIPEFLEALEDFGFGLAHSLLSYPGFENLLCSTPFDNLLRCFPPNTLSDFSLSMLLHVVTDETVLEVLADEELVPSFVDLLANRLGKVVGLEMDNVPVPSHQLSLSSNFMVPTQSAPQTNTVPTYSDEIHSASPSTGSGINLNSVFNSQQTSRYTIHHMVPSSGSLAPNETFPIYSTIAHGNNPAIRPLSTAVKSDYKPDIGVTQRSPKSGFRQNALDGPSHVYGGKSQLGNNVRRIHQGSIPYLQHTPQSAVDSTLALSAFVPDHYMIPSLRKPYGSPHSVKSPTFLAVEKASERARPNNVNRKNAVLKAVTPQDTELSHSGIPLKRSPRSMIALQSATDAQPRVAPMVPYRLSTLQQRASHIQKPLLSPMAPPFNTLLVSSALPRANELLIHPSSAINSQFSRCTIGHVSPSSKSDFVICSQPELSENNYQANRNAVPCTPRPGSCQNVLDGQVYVPGGTGQYVKNKRGSHDSPPYLPRAPHCTIGSTLTTSASPYDSDPLIHPVLPHVNRSTFHPVNSMTNSQHASHPIVEPTLTSSASIPEQSAIPSLPTQCHSPHSIQNSAFLAVENILDLASPAGYSHKKPAQGRAEELLDTKESLSVINCTETIPCTVATDHLEFPGSYSRGSYPPYNSPVDHNDYARVVSPNHHSCSSTVSSLPVVPPPSQQWHYDNQSSGSAESGNTNVGYTSLLDSESSTAVEELTGEWWDRDWSSDSLFSSDSEDGHPSPNHDIGLYHDEPVDGSHLELGLEQPEGNEPQFGYWNDFSYNSDGAGLQSDDLEDSFDDSPDPEYDEEDNHHLVSPNEVGCDNDLQDGLVRSMNEDNDSFYDRNIEPDHHSDSGASEHPDEQEAFSEDGVDPQFEDDNRVSDNGEVRNHFGDEESLFDDGNSDDFEFDDQASQRSDELEISPDDLTHLEPEERGDDGLFYESGDEDTEYKDGASQRSDDWGIPPDGQSDQGYESPCEDDKYYEDEIDQYEYGDVGNPDEYLVLVSQHFPHSLWSLQLPKPALFLQPPKQNSCQLFDLSSLKTILTNTLSSHIPFFLTFAVFENFLRSACIMFVQNLRITRHFVSYLEGTNVVVNYREHLLLPEDEGFDSQCGEGEVEVTHDAMDDLFGVSAFDDPSLYDDTNHFGDDINGCPDDLEVPYDNENQGEPDERSGDNGTYITLISQDFPQSLWSFQSPKTRKFDQSTLPSSLSTTILHPHPVHIPVFDTLASLGHTLQLFNTAWVQSLSSLQNDWVGPFDEEAVENTVSNRYQGGEGVQTPRDSPMTLNDSPCMDRKELNDVSHDGEYNNSLLRALQLLKPLRHLPSPAQSLSNSPTSFASKTLILAILPPYVSFFVAIGVFGSVTKSATATFIQNLQLSRHFVSYLEEMNHAVIQNDTVPRGKNECLDGGVKTPSLTFPTAHFFLVSLPFPPDYLVWLGPVALTTQKESAVGFVAGRNQNFRRTESFLFDSLVTDPQPFNLIPFTHLSRTHFPLGDQSLPPFARSVGSNLCWYPHLHYCDLSNYHRLATSRVFEEGSPLPGYDCSQHCDPSSQPPSSHSQPSPLPIHLHPHHGLDSNMIHPEPTGVFKNDLPQSPTSIICLASMLATNHEPQWAISARDRSFHRDGQLDASVTTLVLSSELYSDVLSLSSPPLFRSYTDSPLHIVLTRFGAASTLQMFVFSVEVIIWGSSNAIATRIHQQERNTKNCAGLPNIQESGISDYLERHHRTLREATRTVFAVSQRDLLPRALIPHPRHPHFLLVTPTSEQPERGAPLPTTPSIIQSPFPVYPRHFGIVDNKAVETTANGQCHEQGSRIGCNIQDLSNILPNDSLEPVKSIVWAPDCSSYIFPPLFSATSFTSNPLVIPSLPPNGAPPQKCYVNTIQRKSYDRKATDTPDVVETIKLSPEEWDPSPFPSNLPFMLALHTLGDIEIFPAHHHASREWVDKETVIEASNNLQIRILPAPPVCITLIPSSRPINTCLIHIPPKNPESPCSMRPHSPLLSSFIALRTPALQSHQPNAHSLCSNPPTQEYEINSPRVIPLTSAAPEHERQRLVARIAIILTVSSYAGFYQHPRLGKAVTTTVNHRSDKREEVKRNIPMHPNTPNQRNPGQISPFLFASRPHRCLSPLADLNTKPVQYDTTSRQRNGHHSRNCTEAFNDSPTRFLPIRPDLTAPIRSAPSVDGHTAHDSPEFSQLTFAQMSLDSFGLHAGGKSNLTASVSTNPFHQQHSIFREAADNAIAAYQHEFPPTLPRPTALPPPHRCNSSRLGAPFIVVIFTPPCTGLYQHPRFEEAESIAANNQCGKWRGGIIHDELGTPSTTNYPYLNLLPQCGNSISADPSFPPSMVSQVVPVLLDSDFICNSHQNRAFQRPSLLDTASFDTSPCRFSFMNRTSLVVYKRRVIGSKINQQREDRNDKNDAPINFIQPGYYHLPFGGIESTIFILATFPYDHTTCPSPIILQTTHFPKCLMENRTDWLSAVYWLLSVALRHGAQPVTTIVDTDRAKRYQRTGQEEGILVNIRAVPLLVAPRACPATKRNLGWLIIEVGRQEGKAYVMETQTWCIVIKVHFVGFHATSGSVYRQQLLIAPPGILAQGTRPENGQSGSPGMVFQDY
ncbi:hypothetical protein PQX77_006947 [Marasmius sp. AFHP31]|nr:hypothetical protein PQX77_006947 [Marasmius sp. AFHP31]